MQTPDDRCLLTGKVRHRHRGSAAAALRQHERAARRKGSRVEPMAVYYCRHCGGWHVGNDDPGKRPTRRPVADPPGLTDHEE